MENREIGRLCSICHTDEWYKRNNGRPYCRPCAIARAKAYYIEHHYNDADYRIKENAWKREQKRRKRASIKAGKA